jgi:hypothetical protein
MGRRAGAIVWETGLREAVTFSENISENLNKKCIIIIIIIIITIIITVYCLSGRNVDTTYTTG